MFVDQINNTTKADSDDEKLMGEKLLKKTFLEGNQAEVNKGDKIKVVKGDLQDLDGTVVTIENGYVHFKPNYEGFDDVLKIDSTYIVKYFEPGD